MATMAEVRIEDLIPHRGRMKWVDDVLEISDILARTSSRVTERWPLDETRAAAPVVLIELVSWKAGSRNRAAAGRRRADGWWASRGAIFSLTGFPFRPG